MGIAKVTNKCNSDVRSLWDRHGHPWRK